MPVYAYENIPNRFKQTVIIINSKKLCVQTGAPTLNQHFLTNAKITLLSEIYTGTLKVSCIGPRTPANIV